MVGLKTVFKSLHRAKPSKFDPMKEKTKIPKGKKLKSSKSLIDISIFKDNKKKSKKKERDRLVASSWDVSAGGGDPLQLPEDEQWSQEGACGRSDPTHKKGHLRRSSSVDNLSLYSSSYSSPSMPEVKELNSSTHSSRSPSTTATGHQDSSDDSLSMATTATLSLGNSSSRQTLNNLSQSTPVISPNASYAIFEDGRHLRHGGRTKKFLRRFPDVDSSEKVLDYYSCALVSDILLQGTLFITDNYFAFHSNIFGYVSKILIPVHQVTRIQKEKTAKFIPNAVRLQSENGETYVFSSLLSRDSTYRVMMFTWRKAKKIFHISSDDNTYTIKEVTEVYEGDSCSLSGDSLLEDEMAEIDEPPSIEQIREFAASAETKGSGSASGLSDEAIPAVAVVHVASSSSENPTNGSQTQRRKSQQVEFPSKGNVHLKLPQKSERQFRKSNAERKRSSIDEKPLSAGHMSKKVEDQTYGSVFASILLVPFRLVFKGVSGSAMLFQHSMLSTASSLLVILLLISAAFMLHRVEELGDQLAASHIPVRGDLYEEVLLMQQKLHSVLATDVEKNIDSQLKQLATVRESLESLMYLFNEQTSQSPDQSNDRSPPQTTMGT